MKKVLSVLLATIFVFSCFSMGAHAATLKKLDLAFVIDTTGSMGDDIREVKANMENYLNDLRDSGMDFRVAIVDYRDFAEKTGYSGDYPYNVALDFSADYDTVLTAIESLSVYGGGDWKETICSALIDGLDRVSWRKEAGKVAILMGDAPALDPEPYTRYTKDQAINKLLHNDIDYDDYVRPSSDDSVTAQAATDTRSAVTLFSIATDLDEEVVECFKYLAEGTGGTSYSVGSSAEISEIIEGIIDVIPDVVENPDKNDDEEKSPSFWQKIWNVIQKIFWFLTFQWKKIWPGISIGF